MAEPFPKIVCGTCRGDCRCAHVCHDGGRTCIGGVKGVCNQRLTGISCAAGREMIHAKPLYPSGVLIGCSDLRFDVMDQSRWPTRRVDVFSVSVCLIAKGRG